jgi:hypothetical protein
VICPSCPDCNSRALPCGEWRSKAFKRGRAFVASLIRHIRNSNLDIFEIQVMPAAQTLSSTQD